MSDDQEYQQYLKDHEDYNQYVASHGGDSASQKEDPTGMVNTILSKAARGASLGFDDELSGGLAAAARPFGIDMGKGRLKDLSFASPTMDADKILNAYKTARDATRQSQNDISKERPLTSMASEITGGLLNPLAMASRIKSLKNAGVLAKAGIAGVEGGIYALGSSNEENAKGQIEDTLTGAGISATLTAALGGIGKLASVPKMGEKLVGVPAKASEDYLKHSGEIKDIITKGGLKDYMQSVTDKVSRSTGEARRSLGKEVSDSLENAGVPINIDSAMEAFKKQINALEKIENKTGADRAELSQLKDKFKYLFGSPTKKMSEEVITPPPIYNQTKMTYEQPADVIKKIVKEIPISKEAPADRAFLLQQRLKEAQKWSQPNNPLLDKTKSTSMDAYRNLNQAFSEATDGASSEAKHNYQKFKMLEDLVGTKFDDPQKTYNTLSSLSGNNKRVLKETLDQLSNHGVTDLSKDVEKVNALKHFMNAGDNQISSGGATSTSKTLASRGVGAALGGLLGLPLGPAAGAAGATAGAAAFPLITTPANLKKALDASQGDIGKIWDVLSPELQRAVIKTPQVLRNK